MARTKQTARKATQCLVPRATSSPSVAVKKEKHAWETFRDARNWRPGGCFHGTVQLLGPSDQKANEEACAMVAAEGRS
jgi:hypothetical protein